MQLLVFPVVFTAGGSGWTLVPPKAHSKLKDMSLQYVEGSKRLDFLYIYFGSIKWPLCTRERLRATSHTWLKARDHCSPRARIGRKGRDPPSLLHTQDWRPLSIAIWELSLVERAETLQVCFTHITEGPWPLQSKSSHWSKGQRPSKFASHTRLKTPVYCNLRALIGRKGGDAPSLLHTHYWRPVTIAVQELSLVERAETLQVCFTHKTEGPCLLQSKSSHWSKGRRPSKFASHTKVKV